MGRRGPAGATQRGKRGSRAVGSDSEKRGEGKGERRRRGPRKARNPLPRCGQRGRASVPRTRRPSGGCGAQSVVQRAKRATRGSAATPEAEPPGADGAGAMSSRRRNRGDNQVDNTEYSTDSGSGHPGGCHQHPRLPHQDGNPGAPRDPCEGYDSFPLAGAIWPKPEPETVPAPHPAGLWKAPATYPCRVHG